MLQNFEHVFYLVLGDQIVDRKTGPNADSLTIARFLWYYYVEPSSTKYKLWSKCCRFVSRALTTTWINVENIGMQRVSIVRGSELGSYDHLDIIANVRLLFKNKFVKLIYTAKSLVMLHGWVARQTKKKSILWWPKIK